MAPLLPMAKLPVSDKLSPKATMGIALALMGAMSMPTLMPVLMLTPRSERVVLGNFRSKDPNASITSPFPDDLHMTGGIIGLVSSTVERARTVNSTGGWYPFLSGIVMAGEAWGRRLKEWGPVWSALDDWPE